MTKEMQKGSFFGVTSKDKLDDYKATSLSMNIIYELFKELEATGVCLETIAKDMKCSFNDLVRIRRGHKRVTIKFIAKILNCYKLDYDFKVSRPSNGSKNKSFI